MSPLSHSNSNAPGNNAPHTVNGVVIIGPDLFSVDAEGRPLTPIASVFPKFHCIVTGRSIHALQTETMIDYLTQKLGKSHEDLDPETVSDIYEGAAPLLIRDPYVLIRTDPSTLNIAFDADEVLQRLIPKERIQFTGTQLATVRREMRHRGESWRISRSPQSPGEIWRNIRSSRVQVHTGAVYYQNARNGARYLTCEEFMKIRPLLREEPAEALARLREILMLTGMTNDAGAPELAFFLPQEVKLNPSSLAALVSLMEDTSGCTQAEDIERAFDGFAAAFAATAGPELVAQDRFQECWRKTMFCRLFGFSEFEVEEWTLGLSPEFHLNVKWLPGARIIGRLLRFEKEAERRVRHIIDFYWERHPDLASVNIGRVETPQSGRARTGEEREVYLVVLGFADGTENIRIVRLMKWDVLHRIKSGLQPDQAVRETQEYRGYILDRLKAIAELGVPILSYSDIRFDEEFPGLGVLPVFFFERRYVPGMVTDKIPPAFYGRPGFIARLAKLLGAIAADNLVVGRSHPWTGHVYFDDGDEVVLLDGNGIPEKVIYAETTGSFGDWTTPVTDLLPHCLEHLVRHLEAAEAVLVPEYELGEAVNAFEKGFLRELERLKDGLYENGEHLRALFADRPMEPGGIRDRWEHILTRLETTEADAVKRVIRTAPALDPFRTGELPD